MSKSSLPREPLMMEQGAPGRLGCRLPALDVPAAALADLLPPDARRDDLPLPEVGEMEVMRHFVRLSQLNHGIDTGFYPLGSCTMKYNPKINEEVVRYPGIAGCHPLQATAETQGALEILWRLERLLCEIGGMDAATLQPAAGAQGEFVGLAICRACFAHRGEAARDTVLVPDSAHGTNPSSAARLGLRVQSVPSDERGRVRLDALREAADERTVALMLTNPNTLGLFDDQILELATVVHETGGLLYCDGANMNAVLGISRPGDMGFDVMHFNLHKTMSTPHGGGGPGAGPVAVKAPLAPFLPRPLVARDDSGFAWDADRPLSIGRVHAFHGNFGIAARAYCYLRALGAEGLRAASETAVLNANYLAVRLAEAYEFPHGTRCMHEFVLSADRQKALGVSALDIAKRLMDFGFHPPTIYFPLIVHEAMMIEPTETESPETLDRFAAAMLQIAREAETSPETVREAPHVTPVSRLDEVTAARRPILRWQPPDE